MSVQAKTKPRWSLPSRPTRSRRYESLGYRAKRVLLGPALRTSQLMHERIIKRVAPGRVLRPDLLHRLCHRGDPAGPGIRRGGRHRIGPADLGGHRRVARHPGAVLYRQIIKAYIASGGPMVKGRQPRRLGGLDRRVGADHRLHPDRRGERLGGHGCPHLGLPRPGAGGAMIAVGLGLVAGLGPSRPARVGGSSPSPPTCTCRHGRGGAGIWRWAVGGLVRAGCLRDAQRGKLRAALVPVTLFPILHLLRPG